MTERIFNQSDGLTPDELFEFLKPRIEVYVTERILMFYEHAVECGGMSRMVPKPIVSEGFQRPKPDLKVVK
jgi:hypothetical protein